MENEERLKNDLRRLFASSGLAVLATQRGGAPYTSLVAFAACPDLRQLVFTTGRATRKFENIQADSRVSLLVDDRANTPADFRDATAATATGRAREADGEERERLLELFLGRHPSLQEFAAAPDCSLLVVDVDAYYVVGGLHHVSELHFTR